MENSSNTLTPKTILSALQWGWKRILAFTLATALIASLGGYFFIYRRDRTPYSQVVIQQVPVRKDSYLATIQSLDRNLTGLKEMAQSLERESPTEDMLALNQSLREYDALEKAHVYYQMVQPLGPGANLDEEILKTQYRILGLEHDIAKAEGDMATLRAMNGAKPTDEYALYMYNDIFTYAATLGSYQKEWEQMTYRLSLLENTTPAEVQKNNATMETRLDTVEKEITAFEKQVNTKAQEIATHKGLIIHGRLLPDTEDALQNYEVNITPGQSTTSKQTQFLSFVLSLSLIMLLGISYWTVSTFSLRKEKVAKRNDKRK